MQIDAGLNRRGKHQNLSGIKRLHNSFDLSLQSATEDSVTHAFIAAYLKESFQPPDLEDAFAYEDTHLEYTPPLDSPVGAFSCVSVDAFAEDDVGLLVFDLC
jgi:hypothetical protein